MWGNSLASASELADTTKLVPRSRQSTGMMLCKCGVHHASNIWHSSKRLYTAAGGDAGFAAIVWRKDADKEASAITRQLIKFRGPDPGDNWVNKKSYICWDVYACCMLVNHHPACFPLPSPNSADGGIPEAQDWCSRTNSQACWSVCGGSPGLYWCKIILKKDNKQTNKPTQNPCNILFATYFLKLLRNLSSEQHYWEVT